MQNRWSILFDLFFARTAMANFINSWPVGNALALLTLPRIAAAGGLTLAWTAVLAVIVVALLLFMVVYRVPENATKPATRINFNKLPALALFWAAVIWALYNTAFAMIFSFGPAYMTEREWDLAAASSVTSIFIISTAIALPVGGIIADRTGRRDTVIMTSLLGYTILTPLVLIVPNGAVMLIFIVAGLFFGLGPGPIMTLTSVILPPEARAFGMGVFYSVYFGLMTMALAMVALGVFRRGRRLEPAK